MTAAFSTVSPSPYNTGDTGYVTYEWSTAAWFTDLQSTLIQHIEKLEAEYTHAHAPDKTPQTAVYTSWTRTQDGQKTDENGDGFGGGHFAVLRGGELFEKAGVAFSKVKGSFLPEFAKTIPGCDEDGDFFATGISLVFHPRHPHVPIIHMNTRFIQTAGKAWFGGGADLTPVCPNEADTHYFHAMMEDACADYHPDAYDRFKQWCDDYFYIPHRGETRGVGGIFYDYCFIEPELPPAQHTLDHTSFDHGFSFTKKVGTQFLKAYDHIVRQNWDKPITDTDKQAQRTKRARYAEFNLIYDRGIKFGLNTGGCVDAMFMSLPPQCGWD